MKLFCPDSRCENHHPDPTGRWYHHHGHYRSRGGLIQRLRCCACGKTFSPRSLSIDYWTHFSIDYQLLLTLFCSGFSLRGLSRYFGTTTSVIQNRLGRLARSCLCYLGALQEQMQPFEAFVADGIENFCVSQYFPNDIHILAGKESQFVYGFNYALFRRKGRKTAAQARRCKQIYPSVDFRANTITGGFAELMVQLIRISGYSDQVGLYTDERAQYQRAIRQNSELALRSHQGRWTHTRISSLRPRTSSNDLFSVNYLDRELRKDLAEYHRQTVCFARNVSNSLERTLLYFFHHNFCKCYRIGVRAEQRSHAEVAGVSPQQVGEILSEVFHKRGFLHDGAIAYGSFYEKLWRREIPTPLKKRAEYLPGYAVA